MEKWMIVYILPLEVWMDIFCFPWLNRYEFGYFVDQIGNFKFAEHAQFYLHEWGKHKIDRIYFKKNQIYKNVEFDDEDEPYSLCMVLDVPQTPLPENIKSFDSIVIRHFDARIMDFLGRIEPLLTDVELNVMGFSDNLDDLRTILTNLSPLLHGIHSLDCVAHTLPVVHQYFGNELGGCKVLTYSHNIDDAVGEGVNLIVAWLTQPGGPRLCEACLDYGFFCQLLKAIREQFLAAKSPSTFALNLSVCSGDLWGSSVQIADFHLQNVLGEELHGVRTKQWTIQITRHQANCNNELQEWINGVTEFREYGRINICNPKIGPFNASQMEVPLPDEEDDDQQPSTSKEV